MAISIFGSLEAAAAGDKATGGIVEFGMPARFGDPTVLDTAIRADSDAETGYAFPIFAQGP